MAKYHFSDWFELTVHDHEMISNLDVSMAVEAWNKLIVPQFGGTPVGIGDTFDKTKHVVRYNNAIYTPLGNISGYSDQEKMIEELDRMVTFSQIGTFSGDSWVINGQGKPLPYTKLTVKDHAAMTESLKDFGGANLAYIAMIDSPTKPNAKGDGHKIFGSGRIDMSHYECGELFPALRLVNSFLNKTHTYGTNIYKKDGSCGRGAHKGSYTEGENWFNAHNIYMDISPPLQQHQFTELYFVGKDFEKLKLDELGDLYPGKKAPVAFTIDANGTLRTARGLDYETDPKTYSIKVRVKDEHNASIDKVFEVNLIDKLLPITKTGDSYNVSSNSAGFMGSLTTEVGHDVSAYGFLFSESQSKIVVKAGSINLTSNNLNSSQV
jgi:hypothetical protein